MRHEPRRCASFPASSRPATCTSAICSARSCAGCGCRTRRECLFFLADLHALTDRRRPGRAARERPRNGGGADRQRHRSRAKSILFAQSAVPAHAELAWILNGTARMGWLNRMTQWKDKAGKNREGASASACSPIRCSRRPTSCSTRRPTFRSARTRSSISSWPATSRIKFNTDFDVDLFIPPEPFIGGGTAARVMSLRDGTAKMSKSDPSDMSRINLTDSDDAIAQKIRKAKTDPEPLPDDPAAARRPARSEEPGRHLRRGHRRDASSRCWRDSPARASARSSRRWPTRSIALLAAAAHPARASCAAIRPSSTGFLRTAPSGRRARRARRSRKPIERRPRR